ncbi:hypothetical protein QE370_000877 [Aeromicrobium sp. SORGH_AS981]|uniref:hypothetical protein n=1 Tax=Aeromicrobium sp. SORGH_AS_0981 TaxID=3041802 RepID=UPI00285491ED|nr:hypothetical protein [Aeromicrobium sp. SORGH_AS_0981]MDR6117693.1 hypothetical protein [Aeromicrobium sp. SORGH_AS_0981]
MTFILGDRVYDVRLSGDGAARLAVLTVTVDSRYEWSTTVAGWRTVSFGACGDVGYVWSARELVELPTSADSGLTVIDVARWEGEVLLVRDAADGEHAWRVDGDRLLRDG